MDFSNIRYGGFLIIPLKYLGDSFSCRQLNEKCPRIQLTTMDINENVKAMLNAEGTASIGSVHRVPRKLLLQAVTPEAEAITQFQVTEDQEHFYHFQLEDSVLYRFQTEVAFLCLRLTFDQILALQAICCPGFAQSTSVFYWLDEQGQKHEFDLDEWLERFCKELQLHRFFEGSARLLLEAYTYALAVVPDVFHRLEEIQRITLNLHQMIPLDMETEDYSEEDVRFVYAVKNLELNGYRWGCCVTSQTCGYVSANPKLDLKSELDDQQNDGLPVIVLALYEKYTCLRFTQSLAQHAQRNGGYLQNLKKQMLEFRAYGTVSPANLSRWHNVKQIYAAVLELNDVHSAVEEISTKLNIVTEHQQEMVRNRNETIINIITIFGIVSIVASVLSIVQILSDGNPVFWGSTILTSLVMTLAVWITMHLRH
jgi:hypothetical protein